MEKTFRLLIPAFILIAVISLAGFYRTYFSYFPDISRFPFIIHIHFLAFCCWFVLLIAQPVLIRKKKTVLHRKLGRLSYFLAPVLVITIVLLVRNKTLREFPVAPGDASMTLLIGLLDAVSFSLYYGIAMYHRGKLRWHVAFIIAASLVILNPGMSRLLNGLQPGLGLPAAILVPFIVVIVLLLIEKLKYKRKILTSPYLLFLLCWTGEIILLFTVPQTVFWKNCVSAMVSAC